MNEILAPLGGYEALTAALNSGADAVYAGMKRFSARRNAENFTDEQLREAVKECHKRGVKFYVTLNTLVYDSELEELSEYIKTAADCSVDGLIMQDLGAAELARRIAPGLPIHASTQMTLNSVSGVLAAEELGYSRVVIGRELSKSEIEEIRKKTSAELEIFVHGALCVCISGQCYMSSLFGGRSGNRGLCAQPCRLDFTCGERHNVISLRDSSLIPHLTELDGISSFKIEGRMKRPEYVACAADACRKSLDGTDYDFARLSGIFSRGGLTEGYFDGSMSDMNGIRGKEDVKNSANALKGIKELYKTEFPRFKLDLCVKIKRGEQICAIGTIMCGNSMFTVTKSVEKKPEEAVGKPITADDAVSRMSRLGGTMFYAGEITADVDDGLYVSAADLNALRRELCVCAENKIPEIFTPKYEITEWNITDLPRKTVSRTESEAKFRAEVATEEQLRQALELDFDLIYAPMALLNESTPDKHRIAVITPFVLTDCEDETASRLKELREMGFDMGLAHTLGHARLLKQCGFNILGGYRMNIFNSLSARVCADLGFDDITLSIEATATTLAEINSPRPKGIVAYGRLPLMLTRRCPIANGKPCGRKTPCGKSIFDRHGAEIPVLCGGNSVELLNPDVLILSDKPAVLRKFDFVILKFTTERDIKPIYEMYKRAGKPEGKLTRGLYFRGAE